MRTLMLWLLLLTYSPWLAATTIVVRYANEPGEGAWDDTPAEPLPGNPGRTLGEQRRYAHDYAVRLVERMVWIPDDRPITSRVIWQDFGNSLLLVARAPTAFWTGNALSRHPNLPLDFHVGYPETLLYVLIPEDAIFFGPASFEFNEVGDGIADVEYSVNYNFKLDPTAEPNPRTGRRLVATALHEYIHTLGFFSTTWSSQSMESLRQVLLDHDIDEDVIERTLVYHPIVMDQFICLLGDPTPASQGDQDYHDRLLTAGDDSIFVGPATERAAPWLLEAGHDRGAVFLAADPEDEAGALSHVSDTVQPPSIMRRAGADTYELGIVAYMLSDLGWGQVVDSEVALTAVGETLSVGVITNGARNLVVTVNLPEGLSASNIVSTPATCETEPGVVRCHYEFLHHEAGIDITLAGAPGTYQVTADVDHQALHVDPIPANNFADLAVTLAAPASRGTMLTVPGDGEPAGAAGGMYRATADADHREARLER